MKRGKKGRAYKFTEKKRSIRGIISCIGAAGSLLILALTVSRAVALEGKGEAILGAGGVAALFVGAASFIEAVQAVQEKDTFRTIPYAAITLSLIATVLWLALYMMGILI